MRKSSYVRQRRGRDVEGSTYICAHVDTWHRRDSSNAKSPQNKTKQAQELPRAVSDFENPFLYTTISASSKLQMRVKGNEEQFQKKGYGASSTTLAGPSARCDLIFVHQGYCVDDTTLIVPRPLSPSVRPCRPSAFSRPPSRSIGQTQPSQRRRSPKNACCPRRKIQHRSIKHCGESWILFCHSHH